ncbi:uncharacterized protein Z518_07534 [Rhinocladiella mackenziei CBS 650.93]|uniref:Rhinocladiella mackenziei CBS 650.93 unplaced genomic scaffold supercont1.5, whole genome shotgun sequence n=1 Tax=Rhinocladiella mackenziei CBS 650.93 TaxID=1442369 RepID=A0A0D2ILA3_9EURO|nr:uncharacterized protein Z518_07534 [Rhinocladiella mackenziei CBS 650.93]KIX03981.1 hypothetical protein Z518_07534 [Rhinocladiella mackenziei CBS 650.93]
MLAAALLTRNEETSTDMFPNENLSMLLRNWYASSLYCLEQSNYLRTHDYQFVQALGILQMCCWAVGDFQFRSFLISHAIRIGNGLGLPFQQDGKRTVLECELSRRLWWTFIICEWLSNITHRASITHDDFDVTLPLPLDDADLALASPPFDRSLNKMSPFVYHVILSQASLVMHRFSRDLRRYPDLLEKLVRDADEKLAEIITALPNHLHPDAESSVDLQLAESQFPWVHWQRIDLTSLLLNCRVLVTRQCRRKWSMSPEMAHGPRAVCLESARMIISILSQTALPLHQRRYSSYTLRLYNAGLTLLVEGRTSTRMQDSEWQPYVIKCIELLEQAVELNIVALAAVEALRKMQDAETFSES